MNKSLNTFMSTARRMLWYAIAAGIFFTPFFARAANEPPPLPKNPGLPNPTGIPSLEAFLIKLAEVMQKLSIPLLIFAFVAAGFLLVVAQGGKPEERKEWLVRLAWLGGAGLALLAAPMLAYVLLNTCKALKLCPI